MTAIDQDAAAREDDRGSHVAHQVAEHRREHDETPPMVGVPAFTRWVDGRSSWIFWPNERRVRNRIHSGVTNSEKRKATPPDSIRLSTATSSQQLACDDAIVERHDELADGLGRLVSLAGDDDHVAGRALRPSARAIARRRSTSRTTFAPVATPDMMASMIDSGDSERGLSDVTIVRSE